MKELSIEEKAKRYDKAIEKAEKWHNAPNVDKIPTFGNRIIEEIFPELKEIEDEKIRKALIEYFRWNVQQLLNDFSNKEAIAWLEKQGEHNHIDKIEPKFKVCDGMRTLQEAANNITSGLPVVVSIDEEYYHCTNELIAIKDQDDYEYPPMNRAIAWSEEDEEFLRRAINATKDIYPMTANWLKSIKDRVQPKQEWNKGDMEMLNAAISFVEKSSFTTIGKGKNNTIAWLKSLKSRVIKKEIIL